MKVQGHLMLARFIEIHQVFAKKIRLDTFLTEYILQNIEKESENLPKIEEITVGQAHINTWKLN